MSNELPSKLPPPPADTPWPAADWPVGSVPAEVDASALDRLVHKLVALPEADGVTQALLLVHRGRLVLERYASGVGVDSTLQSWSMAKSMLHALVGIMVQDGRLDPAAPLPAREWSTRGDPRGAITWRDALRMRPGLAFNEDYVDAGVSDVIEMLWGEGKDDVAHYAADRPLQHPPGAVFNYSSGTTNIIARALGDLVGGGEAGMRAFMRERLFEPLGMHSPLPKFDAAGTWKGSSFCYCSARDFARFGLLYLRGGLWNDRRLLPAAWVDEARTPTHMTEEEAYGSHWWVDHQDPGRFFASGYEGQRILIAPEQDLMVIRLGLSPNDRVKALLAPMHEIPALFADA